MMGIGATQARGACTLPINCWRAGENISWLSAFGAAGGQTARPSMNSQMRTRGFIAVNIRINTATGVLRATKRVSTRKGRMHANDAGVVST